VVGIGAIKWNWPRAPMLLALVLGDIAERYLFLSYSLFGWTWITRPLVIAFLVVTIAGLLWPLIRGRGRSDPSIAQPADRAIAVGFFVAGAYVLYQASAWPFRTAVFPLLTGAILVALSLASLLVGRIPRFVRRSLGEGGSGSADHDAVNVAAPEHGPPGLDDVPEVFTTASGAEWRSAVAWMTAFFAMFWLLGALVTVPLFAVLYLVAVSRQSVMAAGAYAVVSWAFIYGLFIQLLHIPLPAGALLTSLGVL